MKKCKSCQSEIDSKAIKCPHCQTDQRKWFAKHPIITVIFILFIIGMVSSNSDSKKSNSNKTSNQPTTNTDNQTSAIFTDKQEKPEDKVPAEYKSALVQANAYANTMYMSKKGVYKQLVSEYGGKFSAEAAQYGIDNVKADWNTNALKKAKTYQDTMHLSPKAIHDQLTSDAGERFTQVEADYAIEHLND